MQVSQGQVVVTVVKGWSVELGVEPDQATKIGHDGCEAGVKGLWP